jgi:beta-glucosidase
MTHLRFPDGFVWGAATASFQIEGGIEERGRCIWDDFCRWPGKVSQGDTGDVADDHYHLFREDIALMKALNMSAYRFSISWPRVMPEGTGDISKAGIGFYDQLVDALLEAGITPWVTLYHWDLPSTLQRLGGWAARDTAQRFADHVAVVARRLGDRVEHWITHNEPWVVAFLGNLMGIHAPGWQDAGLALQVGHHVLLSHGLAVPILREASSPDAQVGITLNLSPIYPATDSAEDAAAARAADGFSNRWFLDPVFRGIYPEDMWAVFHPFEPRVAPGDMDVIARPIDFMGINYYTRSVVAASEESPLGYVGVRPEGEYTAMDWEVFPEGLTVLLERVHRDYGPIDLYITENGCAYEDVLSADGQVHDPKRVAYLRSHFAAAHSAIQSGVPLKGYFAWSLMDNFEWSFGYSRRFGIVYVDFETLRRIPKDSAALCAQVAVANAVDA